jgi:hypothetical protein
VLPDGESLADVRVEHRAALVEVGVREEDFSDEGEVDFDSVFDDHLFYFLHQLVLLLVQLDQAVHQIDHLLERQFLGPVLDRSDDLGVGLPEFETVLPILKLAAELNDPRKHRQRNHAGSFLDLPHHSPQMLLIDGPAAVLDLRFLKLYQGAFQPMLFFLTQLVYLVGWNYLEVGFQNVDLGAERVETGSLKE